MLRFSLFAAVLPLCSFANSHGNESSCPNGRQHYRVAVRHIERGGIGYDNGYTTLEAFLASDPSEWNWTPFLDARAHVFDDGKWAANAGVGIRTLWGDRAYGINTYYDYRDVGRLHSNQIGLGLETLGKVWDFRINGYLPVGIKLSDPYDPAFAAFSGHFMLISQKYKSAMKGADAEFGVHFGKSKFFDFYAAAGPYYFVGEKAAPTWGGKARIGGAYKDLLKLEISDSCDRTFHNNFQGQVSLGFSFGPKSKIKSRGQNCKIAGALNDRMLQPVGRQEIIVVDQTQQNSIAINPATGQPYNFIFVNNTSHSAGTYESPYPSLAEAASNSSPYDVIYVFPGDGTTNGMNKGITLKANQKFWGSGITQGLTTTAGAIYIPPQTGTSPTITNTDPDTEGNVITLATNNAISGITFNAPLNDAIYGANVQGLDVSYCTFKSTTTFPIEATFSGAASVFVTNNQFLNNVNGVILTLGGTSTIVCSNNTFKNQTSVSSVPVEIIANNNTFTAFIENNVFNANITGSIRFNLTSVSNSTILVKNNTITNNTTGSQSTLGSSFVVLSTGTIGQCTIEMERNTFSNNTSNALYMHTGGLITNLAVTASGNTISNNGGSGLVLATPVTNLTLTATSNTITSGSDNAIAVIASGTTSNGTIAISGNTITNIGNSSNGVAVNQDFSTLNLTLSNNTISGCEGTGFLSYAPTAINSLTLNVSGNTISNCQNLSSNAASAIDFEQFSSLAGSITNNVLSGNSGTPFFIGSTLTAPTACLTLSDNTNDGQYLLSNPLDGVFRLSPCDVNSANVGLITLSGTITSVQSCPGGSTCSP